MGHLSLTLSLTLSHSLSLSLSSDPSGKDRVDFGNDQIELVNDQTDLESIQDVIACTIVIARNKNITGIYDFIQVNPSRD